MRHRERLYSLPRTSDYITSAPQNNNHSRRSRSVTGGRGRDGRRAPLKQASRRSDLPRPLKRFPKGDHSE